MDRFEKVAWPPRLVTALSVPVSAATEHGGGLLKMPMRVIAMVVFGTGLFPASVTRTTMGPPAKVCPPTEFCGWPTNVMLAGTGDPGGAIVMTEFCVAVCWGLELSTTDSVNVNVPAVVGVPASAPLEEPGLGC